MSGRTVTLGHTHPLVFAEGPSFWKSETTLPGLPPVRGSASEGRAVCRPAAGPGQQAPAWETAPAVTSCGGSGGSSSLASCGVNRKRGSVKTGAVSREKARLALGGGLEGDAQQPR